MNDTIKRLAIEAGFVYWEEKKAIDWSCDYSNEFDKYSKLLVQETIDQLKLTQQYKPCE
jgi:hypothetical protein